jgi:hypothetical protein
VTQVNDLIVDQVVARVERQLPTPRAFAASDALEELVRLISPGSTVPRRLFPGGQFVTRTIRLSQLVLGCVQLLMLVLKCKSVAMIHGQGLAFLNGWIDVTVGSTARTAWASISRLQPFLAVSASSKAFFEIAIGIGIDPDISLKSLPSQSGHVIFSGRRNGLQCIVHYGSASASRAAVTRHTIGLSEAHIMFGRDLPGLLPKIYSAKDDGKIAILVQEKLAGSEPTIAFCSDMQLARITEASLNPPYALYQHASSRREFDGNAALRELSQLAGALTRHELYQCIVPAIRFLRTWFSGRRLQAVPAHGDYAPRNLLLDQGCSRVVGIIDWEWFWEGGVVGYDALQLILEIHALRRRTTLINALAEFLGRDFSDGFLSRHAEYLCKAYDMRPTDLWHVGVLIWLRVLWTGCVVTAPVTQQWLENAITVPAAAITRLGPPGLENNLLI